MYNIVHMEEVHGMEKIHDHPAYLLNMETSRHPTRCEFKKAWSERLENEALVIVAVCRNGKIVFGTTNAVPPLVLRGS